MQQTNSTRRQFLGLAGGAAVLGAVPIVTLRPAEATPANDAHPRSAAVVGEAAVRTGKVKLDVPPLVENGNTVPMTVSVAQPDDARTTTSSASTSSTRRTRSRISAISISARMPAAPRSRPAFASPTARRSSPSRGCPTARSGRPRVDVVVTLAACTDEVI